MQLVAVDALLGTTALLNGSLCTPLSVMYAAHADANMAMPVRTSPGWDCGGHPPIPGGPRLAAPDGRGPATVADEIAP
jgi:hypothetical protein